MRKIEVTSRSADELFLVKKYYKLKSPVVSVGKERPLYALAIDAQLYEPIMAYLNSLHFNGRYEGYSTQYSGRNLKLLSSQINLEALNKVLPTSIKIHSPYGKLSSYYMDITPTKLLLIEEYLKLFLN